MACLMGVLSGCSTLSTKIKPPVESNIPPVEEPAPYYVEMHPIIGKVKLFEGQISQPITVQNALQESGAFKMTNAMTVDLHRQLPNGGVLKLPVEFKKHRQVMYEQDYALHPHDRIIVQAKSNSPLDKLVDQVFGEL